MTFPLPTPPPAPTVLQDTPCRSCGYNLRTLPTTGTCPECGSPVADSLDPNFLNSANPDWLEKVRLGVQITLWSLTIAYILLHIQNSKSMGSDFFRLVPPLFYFCIFIGLWLATTPNPAGDPMRRLRNAARIFGTAWLLEGILNLALAWTPIAMPQLEQSFFFTTFSLCKSAA